MHFATTYVEVLFKLHATDLESSVVITDIYIYIYITVAFWGVSFFIRNAENQGSLYKRVFRELFVYVYIRIFPSGCGEVQQGRDD